MWDWIKQTAQKSLEFGAQHIANQAFVEQLLVMPGDQALQELQAKVIAMDEQTYQGFITSLTIMANGVQQNIQQIGSSTPFGSSYEDQLAYYAAGVQSGMGTGQSSAVHQYQQILEGLQAIAVYSAQFRSQMPAQPATDPANPEAIEKRFLAGLELGDDQQTLFEILEKLRRVAPGKAARMEALYDQRKSQVRKLR